MKTTMGLSKNSLFYNISAEEQALMMDCFETYTKTYRNGEVICYFDEENQRLGILESGTAQVIQFLSSGAQTILEHLSEGDIFGQLFYYYGNNQNISVEATSKCVVRYIDYEHIIKRCPKACDHHSQLVNNVLCMVSGKTQSICEHLAILSQRSIRERLLCYFDILSSQVDRDTFDIPFTMSALADYLSVDRSAMSRELGKMRDEGLLKIEKRTITLL